MIRPHKRFKAQIGKMWIPEQLARRTELTWNEKAVWARLARYQGKGGEARPKLETLAAELGISWDTAQRAVRALEAHKLIRVTRRNHSRRPSLVEFLQHHWLDEAGPDEDEGEAPTPPQFAVTTLPQTAVTSEPQPTVNATANGGVARPQTAVGVTANSSLARPQTAVAEGSQSKDLNEGSHVKAASRTPSAEQELLIELEACRVERCRQLGIDPGKPKKLSPERVNTMLLRAVEQLGFVDRITAHGPLTRWDQLGDVYEFFLAGEYGVDKDPPYPIELFCSSGVLETTKRKYDAAQAAPPKTAEATA